MYNHFASKEEIVVTYLRGIREQFAFTVPKQARTIRAHVCRLEEEEYGCQTEFSWP